MATGGIGCLLKHRNPPVLFEGGLMLFWYFCAARNSEPCYTELDSDDDLDFNYRTGGDGFFTVDIYVGY